MAEGMAVVCEIITFLLQGYCLQYFFGSFLESRFSGRGKTAIIVSVSYGLLKTVCTYLLPAGGESGRSFYRLFLHGVFLTVLVFCCYRAAKMITTFLLTTFLALNEISFFIGYMVMSLSAPVIEFETELFMRGQIPAGSFEQILRLTAALLQLMCCFVWVFILWLSLRKTAGAFQEKEYEMHRTELLFILVPGLTGFLLCVLLRIIMITVEDGMPALLYDRYPVLRILVPAILLLSLLSILYSVKLFQDMILLGRAQNSRIILEQQIDNLQKNMDELSRVYAGVRSLKHDMKNTLAVLLRLASDKDGQGNAELAAYLAELNQSFDRLELRFQTGNAVADALLNMKYYEMRRYFDYGIADDMQKDFISEHSNSDMESEDNNTIQQDMKENVRTEFEFDADNLVFPESLGIQNYDMGVILGNALDNAVEACMRLVREYPKAKPFIRLASFQKGKFFFLEIENSFDGKLEGSSHSEFPATLKSEKQIHGIGFANMKKTAEKYDGAVDYSVKRGQGFSDAMCVPAVFTLSVMLKIASPGDDALQERSAFS